MPDQNNPTSVSDFPPPPMDIPPADASIPPPFPPEVAPPEGAAPPPDSGSAAPSFDIPPVIIPTSPKKKFGGKRVIATILGLLVLVGGLGAGVILVRQQQDIREKAAGPGQSCTVSGQTGTCTTGGACTLANKTFKGTSSGGCVSPAGQNIGCCIDCNSGTCYNNCLCRGNSATECRAGCPTATTTPACTANGQCLPTSTSTCCAGSAPISVSESSCSSRRRCSTSATATTTPTQCVGNCRVNSCLAGEIDQGLGIGDCGAALFEHCCLPTESSVTCQTGQIVCNGSCVDPRYDSRNCGSCGRACATGERCWANACVSTTTTQLCPTGYTTGGSNRDAAEEACEGVCGVRETPTANRICENATIVNAGTATIPNWCYRCVGTAASVAPSPTSPPPGTGPTAQCLDVKAYDTNWNQLNVSQLSQLMAGNTVRFTVAGTSVGEGSIDRARFRINGVQRPEVTQKKPASEEFYDEYTIPEGITTFSIGAQIHHTTLGWSN